jgi:hypothetical protein
VSDPKNTDFTPTSDPTAETAPAELVDFDIADLKEASVETLGSFMLSKVERNYYYPEAPLHQTVASDQVAANLGTPVIPDITAGMAEEEDPPHAFMADTLASAQAYYATITDGSLPDAVGGGTMGPLGGFLDKTSQTDGHALLAQVAGDAWSTTFTSMPNESDSGEALRDKVSAVLKYNRFSPGDDSPYVQDGYFSNGMFSIQNQVGRFNENANAVAVEQLAKIAFSTMLAATGTGDYAIVDADGEPITTDPDSQDSTIAIGVGITTQLAVTKVDVNSMRAKNAAGFPRPAREINLDLRENAGWTGADGESAAEGQMHGATGQRRKGSKIEDLGAKNSMSYGQLNSYLEPFGGPLPTGMLVLAVLAAVAVLIAGIVLAAIMTLIFLLFPPGMAEEPPEPLPLGSASGEPDFGKFSIRKWLMKMLRMPILRSGKIFLIAMFFGVIQFYWRITDAISSGYFIVVSRAAIRDLQQITDSLAEADFSNIVGGLESIFVVLDAFATSTTFQFLNTMAMLGDIVIMSGGLKGKGPMNFSPYGSWANQPDHSEVELMSLHKKSRTHMSDVDPDYRLAWRFGSLPSRYLLPTNILAANSALGVNSAYAAALSIPHGVGLEKGTKTQKFGSPASEDGTTPPSGKTRSNMFTADERQEFEDVLNAYYIPFYLHDLRTNEIIAMHTFVDNISDSFAPEWSAVGGFGRMDDVQIYKKTKRTIGLSFWMVATNPQDLEELYFAINRLVMMVYPQWSKGQVKADASKNSFIQPFSQVPTASPVIRMRLGELFTSNYSLQNIARLFGLGTDNFRHEDVAPYGNEGITDGAGMEGKINEILDTLQEGFTLIEKGEPSGVDAMKANVLAQTGMPGSVDQGFKFGDPVIIKPSKYKLVSMDAVGLANYKNVGGKLKIPDSVLAAGRQGIIMGYQVMPILVTEGEDESSARQKKKARVRYAVAPSLECWVSAIEAGGGSAILCGHEDLEINYEQQVLTAINTILGGPKDSPIPNPFGEPAEKLAFEAADATKSFFNLDGTDNSIIRSFHESGGQGLAGVITNLDFDWNAAPWDERQGSRAPTYCKVTMGFAPIHDIPLGLDFQGGMRAPAYNVGGLVRGLFGAGPNPIAWEESKAALLKAVTAASKQVPAPEPDAGGD